MPEDFFSPTQIVGYIAFAVVIAAFWQKRDKYLLLLNGLAATFWTIQYIMLGAMAGAAAETLVMIRSVLSAFLTDQRHKNLAALFFVPAFLIAGAVTYQQPYDLLMIASCLIATVSMIYLRAFQLRYGMLAATLLWMVFNACAGTIGGALAGAVLAAVKCVTIYRMFRDKKQAQGLI